MLHYDKMKNDLSREMRKIAKHLDIEINEENFPKLVKATSFKDMKRKANDLATVVDTKLRKSNKQFFANGCSGQWQKRWSKDNLARFNDLCGHYSSEYITWLLKEKN